jgi:hypothetical protein
MENQQQKDKELKYFKIETVFGGKDVDINKIFKEGYERQQKKKMEERRIIKEQKRAKRKALIEEIKSKLGFKTKKRTD